MTVYDWGPTMWYLLHIISHTYIPGQTHNYVTIVENYKNILPCEVCSKHFSDFCQKYPPKTYCHNRESIIKTFNDIHNKVNKRLKKKIITLTDAQKIYHPNGKLFIDHQKLNKFINTITTRTMLKRSEKDLNVTLKVLTALSQIFPCSDCRTKLQEIIQKTPINKSNYKSVALKMMAIIRHDITKLPIKRKAKSNPSK